MKDEDVYYNLKELIPIVNLKYRQLKSRVKEVKEKYSDNEELIYKKSNRWYIHKSILKDFNRKRKHIDFKLFITINPEGNYPSSMFVSLVNHIKYHLNQESLSERIKYVLERDNRNYIHIHFLTTYNNPNKLRKIIDSHILSETKLHTNVKRLFHQEQIKEKTNYMKKENNPILIRV